MLGSVLAADVVERLDREANRVRGQAAHHEEQGDLDLSARELQIEYGLRLLAHVIATCDEDDE